MKDLIKRLTEAFGPSGSEGPVREVITKEVEPYVDEIRAMLGVMSQEGQRQWQRNP